MLVENSFKLLTEMSSACNKKDRLKLPDIAEPHANDVLMGRGGKNNQHVGNEKLRVIARKRCNEYQIASKKGKSTISRELVKVVRDMVPPGRFLRKDPKTLRWEDVGNNIARGKTSQVLRDAVAQLQTSPISIPSLKSHTTFAAAAGGKRRRREAIDYDQRDYISCTTRNQSNHRELRTTSMDHQYLHLQNTSNEKSYLSFSPICHLPVTPVSATDARKRPRFYESPPLPVSYQNTPNQSHLTTPTHPLGIMLSPPTRSTTSRTHHPHHLNHPHQHPYQYHRSYYQQSRASAYTKMNSPTRNHERHYVAPSSSGTSTTTTTSFTATTAATTMDNSIILDEPPGQGDFDLFNGELLSNNSDRYEGCSPFVYPDL